MAFPNSYCTQTQEQVDGILEQARAEGDYLAVEVTDGSGFGGNALRWPATQAGLSAAVKYADNLFSRWMAAKEYRIVASEPAENDSVQAV